MPFQHTITSPSDFYVLIMTLLCYSPFGFWFTGLFVLLFIVFVGVFLFVLTKKNHCLASQASEHYKK